MGTAMPSAGKTRSIHQWLAEYGESHTNPTNELIHWICVPTIFFCVVGFLVSIPSPALPVIGGHLWAKAAIALTLLFYAMRSVPLFFGMGVWCGLCFWLAHRLEAGAPMPLWAICLVLFTGAWIGQFIGHGIEGKKPSFLKDLQFLMIGPAWLMVKVYRRLGVGY